MPLETASTIDALVASNPTASDGLSQGDDQIRLIKTTLKGSFPNFNGNSGSGVQSTEAELDDAVASVKGAASTLFPLGSAAAPGITPIGDTNTGVYSSAADHLDFATGGLKAIEIDASQNVALTANETVAGSLAVAGTISGPGTVPIGVVLEWWEDTLPDKATWGDYDWANGQVITNADTRCPALLARWGTKFGGNGVTTMGVMDRREVVAIGKSTMGASTARGLLATVRSTLAAVFGEETHALTSGENGPHTHANTLNENPHAHDLPQGGNTSGGINSSFVTELASVKASNIAGGNSNGIQFASTGITITNASSGSGAAHNNMQPSGVCNFIVRLA